MTYNSARDIGQLLASLRKQTSDLAIRVVVVDNDSRDETTRIVRAQSDVTLIEAGGNLGYAAAINIALARAGHCNCYLILNPDAVLAAGSVAVLLRASRESGVGACVPRILDERGATYRSLRREPSLSRALSDALRFPYIVPRSRVPSEIVWEDNAYVHGHPIDWATGAVMLVTEACAQEVGDWDERYFLYSEEIDYSRRIRSAGYRILYVPEAEAVHRIGGSGSSPALTTLMAVNRIRYYEKFHGPLATRCFTYAVTLHHLLRWRRQADRATAATVLRRSTWCTLIGHRR